MNATLSAPTAAPPRPTWGRSVIFIVAAILAALFLGLSTFALGRAGILYSLYTSLLATVIDTTGLDVWQARALTLGVVVLLWFLPWHLLLFPWIGSAKRQVVVLMAFAALAMAVAELITHDVYFSRTDGRPLKYYLRTLDGYKLAASPGTDPVLGLPYQPITAAVAKEYLLWQAHGGKIQDPTVPEGTYFSSTTGEPLRWYARRPDGRLDMFTLPGFHPAYGIALRPVSAEIVAEYQKQQAALDRQRQAQADSERAKAEAIVEARERSRLTQPLEPGRYLFTGPAPVGDMDGFQYTLTEIDLTPESLQVHLDVANVGRTYVETLHQRSIRLGLRTADGSALSYSAIRAKEGALLPEGASFVFPTYGQRGAFVMEFTRPETLDRTFSIVVNDQTLFSGLNLHRLEFHAY